MTTDQTDPLFAPARMGAIAMQNRVLMAPLTRNRAQGDGVPGDLAATYYRQRATAGVIIAEATQISPMGKGYLDTPGIHTEQQAHAWKKIVDGVHAEGGKIILQLWHVGRISHVSLLPDGRNPVSSTDRAAKSQTFTANGFEDCSKPDALTEEQIKATVADYAEAARLAKVAGFDGIEVHAANGYLIDQFLQDGVNDRTDGYGGSTENRMRFLKEVLDAVADHWPADRTGIRLSPLGQASDMSDSDPEAHFAEIYKMLNGYNLAYLHVVESFPGSNADPKGADLLKRLRKLYDGFYIANGGYDADSAAKAIADGHADAVSFGRAFIANPDLPRRFADGAALNEGDQDTFYGGGAEGYTDYPTLDDAEAA
ncbi:N-ethylmaleimide reductase [Loktanella fryxellensis]|uniref:N-ethylmaleimide reductase n=1 Tax=Loktanella fryxellensis TaxID=245187 RepID=A0A1H7YNS9_9RHOB|nr:alkene reductase [Loktanella fryxellensis]SEM46948.1 N-ethylmaleimide reductase [Loktanella fryxellensis]